MAKVDLERVNEAMDSFLKKAEAVNLRRRDIVENLPQLLSAIRMFERLEELMSGVEENSQRFKVYLDLAQSIASKGENYKVAKSLTEREAYLADKAPKGSDRLSYDEVSELLKLIRSSKLEKFVEFIDAESPRDFQRFRELVVEEASESASKAVKAALEDYRNSGQGLGSVSRKSSTVSDFLTNRVTGYQDFVGDSHIGTAYLPSKGRGLGSKEEYRQAETREEEKAEAVVSASDAIKDFIYNYTPPKDEKNIEVKIEKGSKEEEDSESSLWSTLKTVGLIAGVISAGSYLFKNFDSIVSAIQNSGISDMIQSIKDEWDRINQRRNYANSKIEDYSEAFDQSVVNREFEVMQGGDVQAARQAYRASGLQDSQLFHKGDIKADLFHLVNTIPEFYSGEENWWWKILSKLSDNEVANLLTENGYQHTEQEVAAFRALVYGDKVVEKRDSETKRSQISAVGRIVSPATLRNLTPEEEAQLFDDVAREQAPVAMLSAYFSDVHNTRGKLKTKGVPHHALTNLSPEEQVEEALSSETAMAKFSKLNRSRDLFRYIDKDARLVDAEYNVGTNYVPLVLLGELVSKYGDPRGGGTLDELAYYQNMNDSSQAYQLLTNRLTREYPGASEEDIRRLAEEVIYGRGDMSSEEGRRSIINREVSDINRGQGVYSSPVYQSTTVVQNTTITSNQIPGDL